MDKLLSILCCCCLLILVIQDFKFRAISWVLIPAIAFLLLSKSIVQYSLADASKNAGLNIVFLSVQLVFLFVYFAIKGKKPKEVLSDYLGIGDILFYLVLCFAFTPLHYICFYFLSLLTAILYFVIVSLISGSKKNIPLAGLMASMLIICFIAEIASLPLPSAITGFLRI